MKTIRTILCCAWWMGVSMATAQFQGRVLDAQNGIPLPGATVLGLPDSIFTVTDSEGKFQLATASAHLQVSFVGYLAQRFMPSADEMTISLKPDLQKLNDVVVTAWKSTEQKLMDIPASIGLLTEEQLRQDNGTLIAPALNREPGVFMQSGALNTNRLTIRGIGTRSRFNTSKIRAYFQDIPLTNGVGETNIEDIDLALIGRTEIIKGPSSSLYGSGLGGTLLLYPDRPTSSTTPSLQTSLTRGSYGLNRFINRIDLGGQTGFTRLVVSTQNSDGYRENNEFSRTSIGLISHWTITDNQTVSLISNLINQKSFIPSSLNETQFQTNPKQAAPSWADIRGNESFDRALLGLNWTGELNKNWELSNSLFFTARTADEITPFNIQDDANLSLGLRTTLRYNGKRTTWVLGTEVFDERRRFQTFDNLNREPGGFRLNQDERRSYQLYLTQLDWELHPQLHLVSGLSLNQTRYVLNDQLASDSVDQSGSYSFEAQWTPRLALRYKWSERNYYIAVSRGFSPPTLEETLTPDGQVNPHIQPETGWNYEIGSKGQLGNRMNYAMALYWMEVNNLLVARRTAQDQLVGRNAGRTRHPGLELSLRHALLPFYKWLEVFFWGTYSGSWHRFIDFTEDGQDYGGNELTGLPKHVINAGVDLNLATKASLKINYRYVAAYPITDANDLYNDDYQLVNMRMDVRLWTNMHWQLDGYGGINNFLDEKYAGQTLINAEGFGGPPRYYYPGTPRNGFGGLRLTYRFKNSSITN